jgi:hypothetical protein
MPSLFRRFRKEKDEPGPEKEPSTEFPATGAPPADVTSSEPTVPPASSPSVVETPTPYPPVADLSLRLAPISVAPASDPSSVVRCFLCGTAMEGEFCPKCRMTWKD